MDATEPVTAEGVAELRALLNSPDRTPGPWTEQVLGSEGYVVYAEPPEGRIRRPVVARCGFEAWEVDRANATLIPAAVNALPGLLTELEDLRAKVARVEALADGQPDDVQEWESDAELSRVAVVRQDRIRAALDGPSEATVDVRVCDMGPGPCDELAAHTVAGYPTCAKHLAEFRAWLDAKAATDGA